MTDWVDPIEPCLYLGDDQEEYNYDKLWPMHIVRAWKEKLLSQKALHAINSFSRSTKNQDWGNRLISMNDETFQLCENSVSNTQREALTHSYGEGWIPSEMGDSVTLLTLSLIVLEQSYHMASSTSLDQPQLAIIAIDILLRISENLPNEKAAQAEKVLLRISKLDDLASSRIFLQSALTSSQIKEKIIFKDSYICHLLSDLRVLLKRKLKDDTHFVVMCILNAIYAKKIFGPVHEILELLYLLAEYFLSQTEYHKVTLIPSFFPKVWDVAIKDSQYKIDYRRIQACIAQAMDVMGDLQNAMEIYAEIKYKESCNSLKSCISGEPYWTQEPAFRVCKMGNKSISGVIEVEIDKHLIFVTEVMNQGLELYVRKPGTLEKLKLPQNVTMWKHIRIVPDFIDDNGNILIIVALQTQSSNSSYCDIIGDLLGEFDSSMCHQQNLQLWEYCVSSSKFTKVVTRGDVPDGRALNFPTSQCAKIGNKVMLFSAPTLSMDVDYVNILDLNNMEWFKVSHPYKGLRKGVLKPCLPIFSCIVTATINNQKSVLLLRDGEPLQNTKRGNELVPKFAADTFSCEESLVGSSACVEYRFDIDLPTHDQSGYQANHINSTAITIGNVVLIIGANQTTAVYSGDTAFTRSGHGAMGSSSIDALNVQTMEWRGLSIHNSWLVERSDCITPGKLIYNKSRDCCYLFQSSLDAIKVLCLHNVSNLEKNCMTKPVKGKRLMSKKKTVAYHQNKAKTYFCEPVKECLSCGIFESRIVKLQKCSRCQRASYCSRKCQAKHWKLIHKKECILKDGIQNEDSSSNTISCN